MAEFVYNNTKNMTISHLLFKLNNIYNSQISFKDKSDLFLKFQLFNKYVKKIRELMMSFWKNLYYTQKLQK